MNHKKNLLTALLITIMAVAASASVLLKEPGNPHSPSVKTVLLAPLIKKLEFDTDKPGIRDAYFKNLDELAKTIKDDNYAVSLRGHADSRGKYKYNWVLSDNRAVSVKKYLVNKGVKENRIITTPYGSTVPVASNATAAGRQKNRRVEVELKKIAD